VRQWIKAQRGKGAEVQIDDVRGRGLKHDLELIVVL
jgi:hypothetical protein